MSTACPRRSSCDPAARPWAWRSARASGIAPRCAGYSSATSRRATTRLSVSTGSSLAPGLRPLDPLTRPEGGLPMATIEKSIEVNAPLRAVYNQWTQFEEFPRFMEGVKEVKQIDDTHLHWHAEIGGKDKDWDAVITEQVPDSIIAWRSVSGAENAGRVEF